MHMAYSYPLLEESIEGICEVKARRGSPMVRVHASPACIYGVTCMSLKTRFMHSIVTQIPWSTYTLWTTKSCLNYWIVSCIRHSELIFNTRAYKSAWK